MVIKFIQLGKKVTKGKIFKDYKYFVLQNLIESRTLKVSGERKTHGHKSRKNKKRKLRHLSRKEL